jgi:hypothetical protein
MTPTQRSLVVLAFLGCWVSPARGQPETLLNGDVDHGGFGGPALRLTAIDGTAALLTGGRGGWILNFDGGHSFVLGGGGYGLVTDLEAEGIVDERGEPLYLNLGYGGAFLEYVNHTSRLVHFTAEALFGGGGAGLREGDHDEYDDPEPFFVAEPGVNVVLNVTTFFRMGAGVSYRFVSGTDVTAFSDADLSGPSGVLTFNFGRF